MIEVPIHAERIHNVNYDLFPKKLRCILEAFENVA